MAIPGFQTKKCLRSVGKKCWKNATKYAIIEYMKCLYHTANYKNMTVVVRIYYVEKHILLQCYQPKKQFVIKYYSVIANLRDKLNLAQTL